MFVIAWGVVALMAYQRATQEIEEVFDAGLSQSVQTLLTLAEDEALGPGDPIVLTDHRDRQELYNIPKERLNEYFTVGDEVVGHRYETKLAFQVWRGDELRLRSLTAPEVPMAHSIGYTDQLFGNKNWRVFGYRDPVDGIVVYVAEQKEIRAELAEYFTSDTLMPLILALPVLGVVMWAGVRNGLLPLQRFARDVAQRRAEDANPLDTAKTPDEVRSIAISINGLFSRVAKALERERRFTADAAHELRTPLASLKTQAQVALRSRNDEERNVALHQIVSGVDRATRLIEQMLTLARLEPGSAEGIFVELDLAQVAKEVVMELDAQANSKHIDLGVVAEGEQSMTIKANRIAVAILIRNLVDNAIRYTPEWGVVDVVLRNTEGNCELTVTDNGPGVAESERERVLDRFYRGQSGVVATGCGLGLSIVQRIADLHRAKIELATPPGGKGLLVKVTFKTGFDN
jgi:two-component system sensor histidine kinase QseC